MRKKGGERRGGHGRRARVIHSARVSAAAWLRCACAHSTRSHTRRLTPRTHAHTHTVAAAGMRTGKLLARRAGPSLCSQSAICYYMTCLIFIYIIATLYTGARLNPNPTLNPKHLILNTYRYILATLLHRYARRCCMCACASAQSVRAARVCARLCARGARTGCADAGRVRGVQRRLRTARTLLRWRRSSRRSAQLAPLAPKAR